MLAKIKTLTSSFLTCFAMNASMSVRLLRSLFLVSGRNWNLGDVRLSTIANTSRTSSTVWLASAVGGASSVRMRCLGCSVSWTSLVSGASNGRSVT